MSEETDIFAQANKIYEILSHLRRRMIPLGANTEEEREKLRNLIENTVRPLTDRLVALVPRLVAGVELVVASGELAVRLENLTDIHELMESLEGYECDVKSEEGWRRRESVRAAFAPVYDRMVALVPRLMDRLEESLEV